MMHVWFMMQGVIWVVGSCTGRHTEETGVVKVSFVRFPAKRR